MDGADRIKVVAFDVDGVLTDGTLFYGTDGDCLKGFYARDGMGISLLHAAGIRTAVITGRMSPMVARRVEDLHISYVYQGIARKADVLPDLCVRADTALDEIAYMGDDVNDLPVLKRVGLGAAPADACAEAKEAAHLVTVAAGGHGALREFCEYILKARRQWDAVLQQYESGTGELKQ